MGRHAFIGLALTASVAASLALRPATGADASHGCFAAERDNLARTVEGVVFRKGGPSHKPLLYGCNLRRGNTYRLNGRDDAGVKAVADPELSGLFVAYAETTSSEGFRDWVVVVRSLAHGRSRTVAGGEGGVGSLVVRRDGAGAAIVGTPPDPGPAAIVPVVQAFDREGRPTVLDRGAGIEPRSLTLTDDNTRVYWMHGGEPRTAVLP